MYILFLNNDFKNIGALNKRMTTDVMFQNNILFNVYHVIAQS